MPSYICANGAMVTTAAFVPITTGAAIKTLLQLKAPAAAPLIIWKWGVDFDGTGTTPIKCELIETGSVAATVTAHVAAGVQPYGLGQIASQVQLGTTATGYTASAEGSITATRTGDQKQVLPGNGWGNEWALAREFYVAPGNIVRVRVTAAAAVNAQCFLLWDE